MTVRGPNSAQAHVCEAGVKLRGSGRGQTGAGTSEIRRMLIGGELYSEPM
jgi:hypothetical protein